MALTPLHLQQYCMYGQGTKQCRHLNYDVVPICLKKIDSLRKVTNDKIDKTIKELKEKGMTIDQTQLPIGDNCAGYPAYKTIKQGFDVP